MQIYTNNSKNGEFDKEVPQIFKMRRAAVFKDTERGAGEKDEVNPTPSKTDFSSGLCIKVGIGILVLNERKVLLGKRKNSHGAGKWAPPGGHLEFGETVNECSSRELEEETGLIAKAVIKGPWREVFYPEENKHFLNLYALVSEFTGTLENKEPHKNESWQWFDIAALPTPLFKPLQIIAADSSLEPFLEENFSVDQRFRSML